MFVKTQPKEPHLTNHNEPNNVVSQSELTQGKERDLCDVSKNMQLVRSAGKHATKVEEAKSRNHC